MIYLIGGAPRCGKTTFSRKLASKKRIPWISTDVIATIVKPYIAPADLAKKLPQEDIRTASSNALLRAEIQQAKTLWPGTKKLILQLLRLRHDYVIEGVHLLPKFVQEFKKIPEWEQIKVVYLVKHEEQKIIDGFKQSDKATDWVLQSVKTEGHFKNAAEMVHAKSAYIEKQALKYGFRVVNTETNFKKTLRHLLSEF